MKMNLLKKQKGFTIIEVLIVLAIAGLILLIVFLAVPALQRNGRNTNRKSDVQRILGAISEYQANNNGAMPATICGSANPYKISAGSCGSPTGAASEVNLGYYTPAAAAFPTGVQGPATNDGIIIVTSAKCDPTNIGKSLGGSSRQVAVLYMFEPNSTLTATCADS